MKKACIMRGIPGSGKSTMAKELAGSNGVIHCTDDYFMVDGVYRFDFKKIKEYQDKNFEAFCRSLADGIETVICDKTNVQLWQYRDYIKTAEVAGYDVRIISMPHPDPEVAAARNKHGVPLEVIKRMIDQWES